MPTYERRVENSYFVAESPPSDLLHCIQSHSHELSDEHFRYFTAQMLQILAAFESIGSEPLVNLHPQHFWLHFPVLSVKFADFMDIMLSPELIESERNIR